MGSSVDLQLQLTDHLNLKMKFIILASLFVLSVAEAQWFNPNWQSGMMTYSPYMNNFYNNHHMYKREADSEAEPEADAWMPGFYNGNWQNQMSYMPYMNNFYNHHMYKREAEADAQYYYNNYYGNNWRYPYSSWYGRYPYNFNYNRFYHY